MPNIIMARPPGRAEIDWTGVPGFFYRKVSAVLRSRADAEQLVNHYGSPNWVPAKPVLLLLPGHPTLIGIEQATHPMTARELQDQALTAWTESEALVESDTRGLVMRERGGPVDPAEVQKQAPLDLLRRGLK